MSLNVDFLRDFLLGGVSGSVAKTITAPIERVKLLLQVQEKGSQKYDGMVDCFRKVAQDQGVATFWRGNNANIIRYFPTQALNFAFKEKYQKLFVRHSKDENFWKFFAGMLAAGGAAGATSLCAVYPLDFARTRMAADEGVGEERKYKSMGHCIKTLHAQDGMAGLYRGFGVSVAGIIVYRAVFFGAYDVGKAVIYKPGETQNPLKSLALAFTTDTLAGVVAYPFDTVRRRIMMQAGGEKKYDGTLDCVKKIASEEGIPAFYKGCGSNIVRGLGGALVLVFYDNFSGGSKKH